MVVPRKYIPLLEATESVISRRYIILKNYVGGLRYVNRKLREFEYKLPRHVFTVLEFHLLKFKIFLLTELGRFEAAYTESTKLLRRRKLKIFEKFALYHYVNECLINMKRYTEAEKNLRLSIFQAARSNYGGELASFLYDLLQYRDKTKRSAKMTKRELDAIQRFCSSNHIPIRNLASDHEFRKLSQNLFETFYTAPKLRP